VHPSGIVGFVSRLFGMRRAPLLELGERIACFREILRANNTALGLIARIQEALESEAPLPAAEMRRLVAGVTVQTCRMVVNLALLTGKKQRALRTRFDAIRDAIARTVETVPVLGEIDLVMPLAEVEAALAEVVGQKSAHLGQARKILGAHVPDGVATTVEAYRVFMREGGLEDRIQQALAAADLRDTAHVFEACARVAALIEAAPVPDALERALGEAVTGIAGRDVRLAVRSSALQEGGLELSFAGQYRSLLNVPRERVSEAFKRVIASKYSPQAVTYRVARGFDDSEISMCCCIVNMVDAHAAGVLYSDCRTRSGSRTLVQAVHGLGVSAVDGSVEPDTYLIDRASRRVVERKLGLQRTLVRSLATEGTERVTRDPSSGVAVLEDRQVLSIAELAWRIGAVIGMPLDMEWAIEPDGRIWVLQVRPQPAHAHASVQPERQRVTDAEVLLEGGSRASGGSGSGPVVLVESDLDLLRCPADAVVVTREASPRLAVLAPKVAALVADMGETTGHLATVARELRVPALFATRHASSTLRPGAIVTVDADAQVIYAGRVDALLDSFVSRASCPRDAHRELLAEAATHIVPLNLHNRLASGFSPRRCNSLHDIIRFCHQATIEAIFELGDRAATRRGIAARRLVSQVPIDFRIIDLGGGVRPEATGPELTMEDIVCVPMHALWAGMTDPRLAWNTARPLSIKGFMSSLVSFGFDDDARVRELGEPSYAFLTAEYLSLNSRIGYHFATVDARIGALAESNYLSFRFVGGSTSVAQRSRRAALIEHVLRRYGFETDCRLDLVNARIRRLPQREMSEQLRLVGVLTEFVNHLDMALTSDSVAAEYEQAFANHDFGFGREERA
jgi:pyruvate,water dikinase